MARKKNKNHHKKSNLLNKLDASPTPADSNSDNVNETSPSPTYCYSEIQQDVDITNTDSSNDSQKPILSLFLYSLVNYLNSVPNTVDMLIHSITDNLNELDVQVASNIRLYCDTLSNHMNSTIKNAIEIALIHKIRECASQNCNCTYNNNNTDSFFSN